MDLLQGEVLCMFIMGWHCLLTYPSSFLSHLPLHEPSSLPLPTTTLASAAMDLTLERFFT